MLSLLKTPRYRWLVACCCSAFITLAGAANLLAVTIVEALDTTGLTWNQSGTGWVPKTSADSPDGDLVEVSAAQTVASTLSLAVTGPAAVSFRWRKIAGDVASVEFSLNAVEGFLPLLVDYQASTDWKLVKLQLPLGTHTLAWRSVPGMLAQLDQVTVTPNAPSLVPNLSDPSIPWLIEGGPWVTNAESPPNAPGGSVAYAGGYDPPSGRLSAWIPPARSVRGWAQVGPDARLDFADGSGASVFPRFDFTNDVITPEWQRWQVLTNNSSRWMSITAGIDYDGYGNQGAMRLAGISVSPIVLGEVLDAPEFAWVNGGSLPWMTTNIEPDSLRHGTGALTVFTMTPSTSTVATTITGAGRLDFTGQIISQEPSAHWRVTVDGVATDFPCTNATSETKRYRVDVLGSGPHAVEISAVSAGDGLMSSFTLDDVTFCVPADPTVLAALELTTAEEVWVRQSTAGLWSQDATHQRNGTPSLALAAAAGERWADLIISTEGTPLASLWLDGMGTALVTFTNSATPLSDVEYPSFLESKAVGWQQTMLHVRPAVTEMRLCIHPRTDAGQPLWFDGPIFFGSATSIAEALDAPTGIWTGQGQVQPLVLPDSGAVGDDALWLGNPTEFVNASSLSVNVSGPIALSFRTLAPLRGGYGEIFGPNIGRLFVDSFYKMQWERKDFVFPYLNAGDKLRIAGNGILLDDVQLTPLTLNAISLNEALDAPGAVLTSGSFVALAGMGHDGVDAAFLPGSANSRAPMTLTPPQGGGANLDFWWRNAEGASDYDLAFRIPGISLAPAYAAADWTHLNCHFDVAPSTLEWAPSGTSAALVDQLNVTTQPALTFSQALDTEAAAWLSSAGWSSMGEAIVAVETSAAHQGSSALEFRPSMDGGAIQFTTLATEYDSTSVQDKTFTCWVKRGAAGGATMNINFAGTVPIPVPLTEDWTKFEIIMPGYYFGRETLAISVSVPQGAVDSVVYLDAISFATSTDYNLALETTNLNWTTSPTVPIIRSTLSSNYPALPDYDGYFDGVSFENGSSWVEATMTGPGTVVCKGFVKPCVGGQWIVRLSVDGEIREDTSYENGHSPYIDGPFDLQATLTAGPHTVRFSVEPQEDAGAPVILHSVALVPGDPFAALIPALAELCPGRPWTAGGTQPPTPLYRLKEGEVSLRGVAFPTLAAGETSWLETNVTGSAVAQFVWDSARETVCRVNGRKACRNTLEQYFKTYSANFWTSLDLPAGEHVLRWEGGPATAELRNFTTTAGSEVGDYLAGISPPIIWATQNYSASFFQTWKVVTDGPLQPWDGAGDNTPVPGTGLPVMGAGDNTYSSAWVQGPAILGYDVRQVAGWVSNDFAESPVNPPDVQWYSWGKVITEDSFVEFNISEDDASMSPEIFIRNLHIIPGNAYPAWSAAHGNTAVPLADDDHDGQVNLLEFAFGTDPKSATPATALNITSTATGRQLHLPTLPYDATGLTYEIQTSPDLQTWTTISNVPANAANQPGPTVALPAVTGGKEFVRVKTKL